MGILVKRNTRAVSWEELDDLTPHDQGIAKRILWQPEDVESSLGVWWWYAFNSNPTRKRVLITEGR